MGNAPLSRPPEATSTRVVMPICPRSKYCTTRLNVLFKDSSTSSTLPPPLRNTAITQEMYQEKLQQLQERVASWKGGWATLAILGLASVVVFAFLVAYFIPAFWSSVLFRDPLIIFSVAVFQIVFFTFAIKYIQIESTRLQRDVTRMFREWRSVGRVFVTMDRVNGSGIVYGEHRLTGSNCFCLTMEVLTEEQAARWGQSDNDSVVTVGTDESDDGNNEDGLDDHEGSIVQLADNRV